MSPTSPDTATALSIVERYSARNYHPLPVVLTKGEGVYVYDQDGKKYLDCLSAYSAVNQGHRHPTIIDALVQQAGRLTLCSRAFHNDQMGPFLKQLCELSEMEMALPMNTGAEAVETALKTARKWGMVKKGIPDGQAEIIVARNNFHGRTITAISMSSEEDYKRGFGPLTPGFKLVDYGDLQQIEAAITPNTVGVLMEPIQGEAGILVPPSGFLTKLRELCTKNNVLMMMDEIQTGLARTGKMFCYQHEDNAKPDLLIVGKALGGGVYPVSGVLSSREILGVFAPGEHGSTFGGNPLGAAVGRASLDVIVNEKLVDRSLQLGELLMGKLNALPQDKILEIRGKGLLIGIEIKKECGPARPFCEALMQRGILAKETHHQVIRLAPPLVISEQEIDWLAQQIGEVLQSV